MSRKIFKNAAQGRNVLALFLSVVFLTSLYSAISGFSDAVSIVRNEKNQIKPIRGPFVYFAQLAPAGTSYGFYAPQVCSEFRLKMRLGNTKTRQVYDTTLHLGAETAMLVSSLSSMAQDDNMAKTVATSYASYGFSRNHSADSAEVKLEAEWLPRLRDAATGKSEWVPLATYYFKR